jgi:hypothetical protein
VTAKPSLLRYTAVGIKRVITMAKIPSKGSAAKGAAAAAKGAAAAAKGAAAKDTASRSSSARKALARSRPEKKRVRRVIFKTDQWYENAAMSIGIAGRPKGARYSAAAVARAKDGAE